MKQDTQRRSFLRNTAATLGGVLAFSASTKAMADAALTCLGPTPGQTEGPFFPAHSAHDEDNDLTRVKGKTALALGETIIIRGIITDENCLPIVNAEVEIWQACASGKYNHPADSNTAPLDPNFQYSGIAMTDSEGSYEFRTIKPGAYPASVGWTRPPHIHFKVTRLGFIELTTQLYFSGDPLNDKDLILNRIPTQDRKKVVIALQPINRNMTAQFNIQLERA